VSLAFTGEAAWDLREPWDIREPYEVYEFYDRESWIEWVQREAGRSPDERRVEVAQRKWMEVRHIKGKVTRPSHMSHMVRAHSASGVHGLATTVLPQIPPAGRGHRDGNAPRAPRAARPRHS
jgi:hypothetical protein